MSPVRPWHNTPFTAALKPPEGDAYMTRNDFETYRLAKRRTWRLAQAIQMGRQPRPLLETNLHQQDEALAPLGSAIYQAILQLDKPTAQLIMELRYIHCLTLREIAGETGYSASGVRNIINRALKKVTST